MFSLDDNAVERTDSADHQHARLTSPSRLAALRATGLLDGAANPVLDRLSRLATALLDVPVALVSLVDDKRQHFAGMTGLAGWAGAERGTPLSHSFCQHVVARDRPLIVTDASTDPLLRDNLAFTELGVVGYVGVPLRSSDGETLGAMCAIDTSPVQWTTRQVAALEDLAAAAMAEIELRVTLDALAVAHDRLRHQAVRDPLTGLLNRRGFMEQAKLHLAISERSRNPFAIVALDLDGFKEVNDTLGHDAGDQLLVEFASTLLEVCRSADIVGRFGGDEFVMLLTGAGDATHAVVQARLQSALALRNAEPDREFRLATSMGFARWTHDNQSTMAILLRAADEAMYAHKRARKAAVAKGRASV